jgi:hypothetical protein
MRVILGSEYHQCLDCKESFLYSDSTIDVGLILTMFGIVWVLFTFGFDSFIIESSGVGIYEMLGYVFGLMIIIFGFVFIHLSR